MEKRLQEVLEKRFHKTLDTCTKEELFHALMEITKEATGNLKRNVDRRNCIISPQNS